MENDNSAATVARKKKLQAELAEKQEELNDKQFQHRIDSEKEALNEDLNNYLKRNQAAQDAIQDEIDAYKAAQDAMVKALQDRIDDEQALLADARAKVESDWDAMYADLKAKCEEHGIDIEEIISTWDDDLSPLENYLNMLDLIQDKIDEMNASSVNLQYGEQEQSLKENMEKADQKRQEFKQKLKDAKASGDSKKIAKYQAKYDKWDDRYETYRKQYNDLVNGNGILARKEIEMTEKTFEENVQKNGIAAANQLQNLLMVNSTYKDDTHKMLDASSADWSKAKKKELANTLNMLSKTVDGYDSALGVIKGNSDDVATAIYDIAQQHNIDIQECITSAWNENISALENYRAILIEVLALAAQEEGYSFNTSTGHLTTSTGSSGGSSSTSSTYTGRSRSEIQSDIDDIKAKIEHAQENMAKNPNSSNNATREQKIANWEKELEKLREEKKNAPKYASGLRSAKNDHWGITNEAGREVIVTKSGILTPLNRGDAVLSADQTKNLFDLSKIDASKLLAMLTKQSVNQNVPTKVTNTQTLQIDNLVTITGTVTPDLLPTIEQTVDRQIKKSWKQLNAGIR